MYFDLLDEPGKPAAFIFRMQIIVLQMEAVGVPKWLNSCKTI
jgi:hypothetical protein